MNNNAKIAAILLTTLGVLFFIAMAFQVMPGKYALFGGVACFILAGAVRRIMRQSN